MKIPTACHAVLANLRRRSVYALAVSLLSVLPHAPAVLAQQQCSQTIGPDGSPTSLTGIVNAYYPGLSDATAGSTTISVGSRTGAATPAAAGDLLLVIQMQGADINSNNFGSYGDGVGGNPARGILGTNFVAGQYEYVRLTAIAPVAGGFTMTIASTGTGNGLVNTYRVAAAGTQGRRSFQVVRVPQYLNATLGAALTARAWDGSTGGVLAIDVADTLTLANRTVSVDGLGFRGGGGRALGGGSGANTDYRTNATNDANASKGEGIAGTPRYVHNAASNTLVNTGAEGYPNGSYARGAPGNAGGGGTDGNASTNADNSGGGGGGNCGIGGTGGNSWASNVASGGFGGDTVTSSATRLVMGGGGGAGSTNNGGADDGVDHIPADGDGITSSGGAGGGLVMIRADRLSGTGTISADGSSRPAAGRDGGGGGGAGGTIAVAVRSGGLTGLTARARGGTGGNAWPSRTAGTFPGERHGPGGGGGGGFVFTSSPIASSNVSGGANGITTTSNDNYGSTSGSSGCVATGYTLIGVPGVSSGAECKNLTAVDLASFAASRYATGVLLEWRTGSEADTLGFAISREVGGRETPLTTRLVAGSALSTTVQLEAGYSYAWWDPSPVDGAVYWLDEIDIAGNRARYGPFVAESKVGPPPVRSRAELLGAGTPRTEGASRALEPVAAVPDFDAPRALRAKGGGGGGAPGGGSPQQIQWALAGGAALRLSIREAGWYRVTAEDAAAAGADLTRVDPRGIRMFADGREQAISVTGEADGRFDPGDAVEFYATGVDTPTTDTRVYWLTAGPLPGKRIKVLPASAAPNRQPVPATVTLEEHYTQFGSLLNGDRDNYFGAIVTANPVAQRLTLDHVAAVAAQARLELALQGVTFIPHRVSVSVNGQPVGEVTFANREGPVATIAVPQAALHEGENVVTLASVGGAGDLSLVDHVRITYARDPVATGDALFVGVVTRQPGVTVGGFSSPRVRVVDVTSPDTPEELAGAVAAGAAGYEVSVRPSPVGARTLFAFGEGGVKRPAAIERNTPSSWNAATNGADAVFITHHDFAEALAPLVALRESQGYRVAVVDVEDVFDEFGYGYHTPYAIRAFLARAHTAWRLKPRFVVLAGDATVDPRDYLGFGEPDYVPSKTIDTSRLETYSDDWLADFDGDGIPEMAVGRLPISSADEAATIVSKIVAYDTEPAPPARALLVSDAADIYDFGASADRLAGLMPPGTEIERIVRGAASDGETRQRILDGLDAGPRIAVYTGHGSIDIWHGNILTSEDARGLSNGHALPVVAVANCLNGYFVVPVLESVGEAFVRAPEGGAVAVWASTGETEPSMQEAVMREFFTALSGGERQATLGEAAVQAKRVVGGDVRTTWVLLGDPMTRLR